ncbi:MAG TPA: SDR family oxidoreductase [Methylomirabilota bacterium]|jgi:3-oxoacyl-[acyl-carrier protein] reductase
MDLGLAGKVALVTAASKGMGRASAMGLAAEGARIVMCARTEADLKTAAEEIRARTRAEVLAMPADVTRKEDVDNLVDRAMKTFGRVDILVANAGGPPRGYFEDMTDEQWQGAFDVSLLSVVRLVRGVLPSMKAHRWGRILTIQSVSVKQPIPELLLSNAVRPGVAGMMKTLAGQLGKDGITVNTVCPGKIMTDRFLGGQKISGLSREEYLARAVEDVPVRRVGTPEEFANVVVFLASERASYVTGLAVQVDGGLVRGLL